MTALHELYAARIALLKMEAEIWLQREAIATLYRAAEKAENALLHNRPASASSIENWQAGGKGAFPGTSSMDLARLQENAIRARNAASVAEGENVSLAFDVEVLAKRLESNRIEIEAHGGDLRRTG